MKRNITETVVKNFIVEGHTFVICKDDDNHYWGFNKEKAKTKTEWNGMNGHRSESLNETMRQCYLEARFENEIDAEKYKALELEEIKKYTAIIEESFELYRK